MASGFEDYTYTVSDGKATITGYTGAGGDIIIPSLLGGYPVEAIGDNAFRNCAFITSVIIPDGIASIGRNAFRSCTSLTSVAIGDSVTTIGVSAFESCTSLTSVAIGDSVTTIGDFTFYYCSALTTVNLPASVSSIGVMVFAPCTSLTEIDVDAGNANYASLDGVLYNKDLTILVQCPGGKAGAFAVPDGVIVLYSYSFYRCNSIASVTIPASVTTIGGSAISACAILNDIIVSSGNANFSSVDGVLFDKTLGTIIQYPSGRAGAFAIPDSVHAIGWDAFSSCSKLTSLTMPGGITRIDPFTFEFCTSLTSIVIGHDVVYIGGFAFWGCTSLTSVIVPDGLSSIGAYAFAKTAITSFTINKNVTLIEDGPFYSCPAMTEITVDAENANYVSVDGVLYDKAVITLIEYPSGKAGSFVIPNSVISIRDDAFASCTTLTSVTIPDSVTDVGGESFLDCVALTSVSIGRGVTTIGDYSFSGCANLTSISLLGSVATTYIGTDWLADTSVDLRGHAYAASNFPKPGESFHGLIMGSVLPIPEDYTYTVIDGKATITDYIGAGGDITIPSTLGGNPVVAIGEGAFAYNTSLTSVTIPEGIITVDAYAFVMCTSLTSVHIGSGVTFIGDSAFEDCPALTAVNLPASVTSLGSFAFASCSSLASITVDAGNANYACLDGVLYNKDLTALIQYPGGKAGAFAVPASVTTVGGDSFYGSSSMTSVTIHGSVTSIGALAFKRCAALTEIVVDAGNVNYASVDGVLYNKNLTALIQYPGGKAGDFTTPDSVTSIGFAFQSNSQLTSLTMSNGITSIGSFSFMSCTSLTSIVIGRGVVSIGGFAFWGCTSLTSVIVPDGLSSIGAYTFAKTAITSFTITKNVTSIGNAPFYLCSALTQILVEAENTRYASIDGVLYDKAGVTLIEYPSGRTGAYAIPDGVVSIGDVAFYGAIMTSVMIPDSVTSTGNESFLDCVALTSVSIGRGVTTIGDYSFSGCANLTSISFLGSVAPTEVGTHWIDDVSLNLRGHAYAASNFPAPGADFHGLIMGTVIPVAPDAPTNLTVSLVDAKAVLAWVAPGSGPITNYNVYRCGSANGTYVWIASSSGTNYTDLSVASGQTYWYQVSANNSVGEGARSTAVSLLVPTSANNDALVIFALIVVIILLLLALIAMWNSSKGRR